MYLMLLDEIQMDWKKDSVEAIEKYEKLQLNLSDISEDASLCTLAYVLFFDQRTV